MRKGIYFLGLAAIGIAAYFLFFSNPKEAAEVPQAKPQPLSVSAHSTAFNTSFHNMLTNYYAMSESLVNWDKDAFGQKLGIQVTLLDSLPVDDLKKDSLIYISAKDVVVNMKGQLKALQSETELEPIRRGFNELSETLRQLFIVVKYDREKVYWQHCPMAFNDEESANWLSDNPAIRNPYLGTQHPRYKASMLNCGEVEDSLVFFKEQ